jgi:hypothetical protein
VEQELNRRRSAVFADEHGGMIGAVAEFCACSPRAPLNDSIRVSL